MDVRTDRQTDRHIHTHTHTHTQTDKSDFIACCLTNVERPKAEMVAYKVKCKAERKRFGNIVQREDLKWYAFKTAKRVVITNQDTTGEQCIVNDNGLLAVSDEDQKIASKS